MVENGSFEGTRTDDVDEIIRGPGHKEMLNQTQSLGPQSVEATRKSVPRNGCMEDTGP